MEIKDYLLDANGKVTHIVWENGQKTPIPYWVEWSLRDFDGDRTRYREFVDGLTNDYEQERIGTLPGEPVRSMFPSEDVYQSRKRMWEQEQVQEKLIEKHRPAPPPPPYRDKFGFEGLPPDEHKMTRLKLFQDKRDWEDKLMNARRSGDTNAIDRAEEMIRWAVRDLGSIPEAAFQRQVKIGMENEVRNMISVLFDSKLKNNPQFGNPRMDHDILDALYTFNKMDRGNIVVLPREEARGAGKSGRYRPLKPGNFVQIDLGSREKKDEFLRYIESGRDPHEWCNVRNLIPEDKEKLSLEELEHIPERQSQTQYEVKVATGKLFSDKALSALNRQELETLKFSGTWPEGKPSEVEEEPEPGTKDAATWEESLKPVQTNQ